VICFCMKEEMLIALVALTLLHNGLIGSNTVIY
jgi:hypothetical protein